MAPWPLTRGRALALALLAAASAALVLAPAALAGAISPEAGGGTPNARDIKGLYDLVLSIGLVIGAAVIGALIYSLIRFRYRRGAVAAQIRGNTQLEIGWTVAAALILVFLTIVTFIKLPEITRPSAPSANAATAGGVLYAAIGSPPPPGGKTLNIAVSGQQYVWRYTYPNGAFAYDTMVVPMNTTVTLDIRAVDVIHSWWIPKLGGKQDAVPGYTNHTWFRVTQAGVYRGQCAELCGRNHANMLAEVRAVPQDEYARWVAAQKAEIDAANKAAAAETQAGP